MKKRSAFVFNFTQFWGHLFGLFFSVLFMAACDAKKTNNEEPSPLINEALDGATIFFNSGQVDKAFDHFDSVYNSMADKNFLDIWEKYNFYANYYLNHELDLVKSEQYLDSMFLILEQEDHVNDFRHVQTKFLEGDFLKAKHKYNNAFLSYFNGREYAIENLDDCNVSNLTYRLGMFRFDQKQYKEAIPFFKKAIAENLDCLGNESLTQNINEPQNYRNTLALCYEKISKFDSAVYYYVDALAFLEEIKPRYPEKNLFISSAMGVVRGNLGGVMAKLNKVGVAKKLLKSSIEINSQPNYDRNDAQTAKLKLTQIYIDEGSLDKALVYLNELDKELPNSELNNRQYLDILLRWYLIKGAYFENIGDMESALASMNSYYHLNDSIQKIDQELKFVDVEGSFRNAAQKYELSLVNRDNKIKNIYLATALVFTILLAIFLIFNWNNLKKLKKTNNLILQKNQDLQDTLNALEFSQSENTKIMYMVAHDLRNPISSMIMMANLILDDPQINGENKYLLENIKTSCSNSMNLITEILLPNKNDKHLLKEEVQIDRLLKYCVEILNHKAEEKQQKIHLNTLPVTALISKEKMWRVITNLIANAIKFTPVGKSIEVIMKSTYEFITIIIRDEGIGIPNSLKSLVFDWDTLGKREGTNGEKPFGMGLAISKQIISAHNGKIWFESKENVGTTFFIEFPVKN
ncbi:tetratricopeptide repeat-containing sensor histidine kinase [uncultured Cyclobacterium sp.]|uniref:tetratricopeptide repeat-containing sensor histidine kinase n=1 Tax=uncultured Cyclobacterium sp. TaxID=453820 RepID=UPI0030EED2D9|tara:strand:- start:168345 stop:170420 length:2076 start_codon:yes stop_codon:yes gene_type:complete